MDGTGLHPLDALPRRPDIDLKTGFFILALQHRDFTVDGQLS